MLKIQIPRWAKGLVTCNKRNIGIKGGRGSGKSHFMGEVPILSRHIADPQRKTVCIREVQKSLKFSSKALIEQKIRKLGVSNLFDITQNEIKDKRGSGIIIFQGMQDHTADSIKSLEGFDCAWVEEAQNLSHRSLELLRPTIRKNGSQLYFSWNPEDEGDAVDKFMLDGVKNDPDRFELVHVNFDQNIFISDELLAEEAYDRKYNPDTYDHKWLGLYNERSDIQVFKGKWFVEEFEPTKHWHGVYQGLDFGFNDPLAAVQCWIHEDVLYIGYEAYGSGVDISDYESFINKTIPNFSRNVILADNARPESISHLKKGGYRRIKPCEKGKGSVEDGVAFMRSFKKIVIHPRCKNTINEFRYYSYKVDKLSGQILDEFVDDHNHAIDAIRYALEPIMKRKHSGKMSQEAFNILMGR